MKTHKISELISFAVAAIIAIGAVALALRFPHAPDAHSGPGSFPLFLGVVLAALSVCGIIQSFRKRKQETPKCGNQLHMLLLGVTTALYLLLMPLLGFITATTLLCMAVLMIHGYRNPVRAMAAGFIAAFTLYGIFGLLMNVVLPKGWIG
ncbi:MAG: tripartite tricarboxylate transporter TctB family protein [Kiritimatiellae bacterium]|jgi:hypothetical protein|nr:tripartite tricarboxylate transporter TctB family protein [Kiritimatiellia bacterium]